MNRKPGENSPVKSPIKSSEIMKEESSKGKSNQITPSPLKGSDYWGLASNILDDMTSSKTKPSRASYDGQERNPAGYADDDFELYENPPGNQRSYRNESNSHQTQSTGRGGYFDDDNDNNHLEDNDEDDIFLRPSVVNNNNSNNNSYKTPLVSNATKTIKASVNSSSGNSITRSLSVDRHASPSWGAVTQPVNIYDDEDASDRGRVITTASSNYSNSSSRPTPLPTNTGYGEDSQEEDEQPVMRGRLAQSTAKKLQRQQLSTNTAAATSISTPAPASKPTSNHTFEQTRIHHSSSTQESSNDGKIIRPVSALKKDMPRSTTPGRKVGGGNTKTTAQQQQIDELQISLEAKAKELEKELETYK